MIKINLLSDVNNSANLNLLAKAVYGESANVSQTAKGAYLYSVVTSTGSGDWLKAKKLGDSLRAMLNEIHGEVTYYSKSERRNFVVVNGKVSYLTK